MTTGAFPLTGVAGLPNVTVANGPRARHYSDRKASGAIVPGSPVLATGDPNGSANAFTPGDHLKVRVLTGADAAVQKSRIGIALRTIQDPDVNTGPTALGPNEIMNQTIADGEYVHAYYEGDFWLTLVVPGAYVPGDLVGWQANGVRPAGKAAGAGAWAKDATADVDSVFEVQVVRRVGTGNEVILGVRKLT